MLSTGHGTTQAIVLRRLYSYAGEEQLLHRWSGYARGIPVNGYRAPPPRDPCMARSRDRHPPTGGVPNPTRHPHTDTVQRLAKGQHAARKQAGTAERHPRRRNGFLRSPSLLSRLGERHLDRAMPATEHSVGESSPVGAGSTHTLSVPTGRRGAQGRRPRRPGSPRTRRRYRGQLSQLSERPAPPP